MSGVLLTCIVSWGPGIPDEQAEGTQERMTWSDQAQEPSP